MQVLDMLHQASAGGANAEALCNTVATETVSGLFRDLHGVAQATIARRDYMQLFDWLYPQYFPVILACLQAWAILPLVTTPLLKFMVEFVSNKGQCMVFESSSPNGILLFREVSKVLAIYSSSVMQVRALSCWHMMVLCTVSVVTVLADGVINVCVLLDTQCVCVCVCFCVRAWSSLAMPLSHTFRSSGCQKLCRTPASATCIVTDTKVSRWR